MMTGPNDFIHKNPGIEGNQVKNVSHGEGNVIKSAADLDLINDLQSELRTGLW